MFWGFFTPQIVAGSVDMWVRLSDTGLKETAACSNRLFSLLSLTETPRLNSLDTSGWLKHRCFARCFEEVGCEAWATDHFYLTLVVWDGFSLKSGIWLLFNIRKIQKKSDALCWAEFADLNLIRKYSKCCAIVFSQRKEIMWGNTYTFKSDPTDLPVK